MRTNNSVKNIHRNVPGPGEYSLPSFIDVNRRRKISFHSRNEEYIKQRYPAPNAYNLNYTQVEKKKSISFGKNAKLKDSSSKNVGPGAYSIKSLFDNIVEKYKMKRDKAQTRSLMKRSKSYKDKYQLLRLNAC